MYWLYLAYYLLLLMVCLAGLGISVVGLPGLWLMVASAVVFSLATGGVVLTWQTVVAVALLAVASEVAEFLAGAAGSKTAGGTWRGIVGAVVGGIAGGIIGVPIPILGPILGAILGAAVGAGVLELTGERPDFRQAGNVALGAAKGRFWGVVSKLSFGTVMLLVLLVYAFPLRSDVPAQQAPPAGEKTLPSAKPEPTVPNATAADSD